MDVGGGGREGGKDLGGKGDVEGAEAGKRDWV